MLTVAEMPPGHVSSMRRLTAAGYYRDPSEDAENAFLAGLLPALERLVREGPAEVAARGEAEQGLAEAVLTRCLFDRSDWDRIMPYAAPWDVAGLVWCGADWRCWSRAGGWWW